MRVSVYTCAWIQLLIFLKGSFVLRYGESFPVSDEVLDPNFCLPIGKAKVFSFS